MFNGINILLKYFFKNKIKNQKNVNGTYSILTQIMKVHEIFTSLLLIFIPSIKK